VRFLQCFRLPRDGQLSTGMETLILSGKSLRAIAHLLNTFRLSHGITFSWRPARCGHLSKHFRGPVPLPPPKSDADRKLGGGGSTLENVLHSRAFKQTDVSSYIFILFNYVIELLCDSSIILVDRIVQYSFLSLSFFVFLMITSRYIVSRKFMLCCTRI
jgi:hypothetical protein